MKTDSNSKTNLLKKPLKPLNDKKSPKNINTENHTTKEKQKKILTINLDD